MYNGATSIQSLVLTDALAASTGPQSISLPANATSLTLHASSAVFMSLTEQGLDITRQRFALPDGMLIPIVIPAPKSSNYQVWFQINDLAAVPNVVLSVVVNCG